MEQELLKYESLSPENEPLLLPEPPPIPWWKRQWNIHKKWITVSVISFILIVIAFVWGSLPPNDFPIGGVVNIPKNSTLSEVAEILDRTNIVRSKDIFKIAVLVLGGKNQAMAGDYLFSLPKSSWTVASRIINGEQDLQRVRVTIPEGSSLREIKDILVENIPGFDAKSFMVLAKDYEGYLFPDTYFFFSNVRPESVIETLNAEFDQKFAIIAKEFEKFGRKKEDVVIMASMIEKETTDGSDRNTVSGVLWKRLDKGMLLQVDPTVAYALNKSGTELTYDDLKVNSPYNTYKYKGLPVGPISNPGLESLRAAVSPTTTPYWFYLSDSSGKTYFSKTYDEHLAKKDKYIK